MQMCVCGAANTDEAKYCGKCGAKLEPPLPRCRNCNAELFPGAGFCTGCGTAVDDAQIDAAKAKTAEEIPSPYLFFDAFRYLLKRVETPAQAKAMAQVGAAAAGLIAIVMGFFGLLALDSGAQVLLLHYGQVAVHAVCAWLILRGVALAGMVSLALHLFTMVGGFVTMQSVGFAQDGISIGSGFLLFAAYVVAPVGLVTGIRGCLAWSRFRREGGA